MSSDSQPEANNIAQVEDLVESIAGSFYAIRANDTTADSTCAFTKPKHEWLIDKKTGDAYMVTGTGLLWRAAGVQYGKNTYVRVLAVIAATPGADGQSALAQLESIDRALNAEFDIEEAA